MATRKTNKCRIRSRVIDTDKLPYRRRASARLHLWEPSSHTESISKSRHLVLRARFYTNTTILRLWCSLLSIWGSPEPTRARLSPSMWFFCQSMSEPDFPRTPQSADCGVLQLICASSCATPCRAHFRYKAGNGWVTTLCLFLETISMLEILTKKCVSKRPSVRPRPEFSLLDKQPQEALSAAYPNRHNLTPLTQTSISHVKTREIQWV